MVTVAQNIVDTLKANGVRRVYGVPGDSLNGLTEALRTSGIDWVHVRHEEAAAFAAAAEAEVTGRLAVCVGSCGPGNLHLINGLFDAQRSRVPVLAIAAHIPSVEIGSNYFQETHPQELFRECSHYAEMVSSPVQMPRSLRIAMQTAISQRGVSVLVIPGDVSLQEALDDTVTTITVNQPTITPSPVELERAAELLDAGRNVTILAGAGVAGAREEVLALADALGAPIVHALRGKEYIEYDNPFDVGMTGLLGFSSGYHAMEAADTLLMLGTDFPYTQFLPQDATVIQVDVRGEQLGRRVPLDLGLVGDVASTSRALTALVTRKKKRDHLKAALKHYRSTRKDLDELATPTRKGKAIHPQYVARLIDELAADDAVVIPDVGSPVIWASRYLTMKGTRRLIGSFWHGSMANALPMAIGAQAPDPRRQVIGLCGDGGLGMLMGELLTLGQNPDLPVKLVVLNNSSLNFVELEMKAAGFVTYATDLTNQDLAGVARACGLHAERVENAKDLEKALRTAFDHDGPALVEVSVDRQELSMPPTVTMDQAKGFALFALRTVLSGRGTEIIELARTNARQLI